MSLNLQPGSAMAHWRLNNEDPCESCGNFHEGYQCEEPPARGWAAFVGIFLIVSLAVFAICALLTAGAK